MTVATSLLVSQSSSSELILADVPVPPEKRKAINSHFAKEMCASIGTLGFRLCTEIKYHNAAYLRDSILYRIAGEHEFLVEFRQGKFEKKPQNIKVLIGINL